jgi:electron transport complex protein RnfG
MKNFVRVMVLIAAMALIGRPLIGQEKAKEQPKEAGPVVVPVDKALKKVFPDLTNKPESEVIYIDDKTVSSKCDYEKDKGCKVYPASKKGALLGYAIAFTSEEGFKAPLKVLVGLTPAGDITGIEVLEQAETPERGGKISDPEFQKQFAGKNLKNTKWSIDKDKANPGDIKAIAGASFSSKAVAGAVKDALDFYDRNKAAITKTK